MKSNSLHAKLYKFTYDSELPNSLCIYVRKILWAFLMFIPNIMCSFPLLFIKAISKKTYNNLCYSNIDRIGTGFGILLITILFYFYIKCTYNLIRYILHLSANIDLAGFGMCYNCLLIFIFIVYFIEHFSERNFIKKDKKSNIIIEFIKAKYNKYCPKIEWDK